MVCLGVCWYIWLLSFKCIDGQLEILLVATVGNMFVDTIVNMLLQFSCAHVPTLVNLLTLIVATEEKL